MQTSYKTELLLRELLADKPPDNLKTQFFSIPVYHYVSCIDLFESVNAAKFANKSRSGIV